MRAAFAGVAFSRQPDGPSMSSLLCVGIATLDYVYGVEALPTEGRKYRAGALEVVGGGIAANAAVAAARLGGEALLATRLGDDATGDAIRAELAAEGVDLALSNPVWGRRSPVSAIMVDPAGERMIVSYSDGDMPDEPDWLAQSLPKDVGAVLGDTRWEKGALRFFHLARQAGLPAILDGDRKPADPELLAAATHIAFSEVGLAELTGLDDPHAALHSLDRGDCWLAVTMGPAGVLVAERGEIRHHPAFAVEAVDTLGAGDVWHGAFALALAEGRAETEAIRFASAAASIKCTRFGGRKGAPGRAEVERFLRDRS
jgi:sulfofructose kinase